MLSEAQKEAVVARVARLERATGLQVVTAVTPKADAYPEIPWCAFALAAAMAGLAVVVADLIRPDWGDHASVMLGVVAVLLAGATSAAATLVVPAYARLFLHAARRDREVRQYAQCLFLEQRLERTREHDAVLLLVARFERKVELVADTGFDGRLGPDDWRAVVAATSGALAHADLAAALIAGLDRLEQVLAGRGFVAHGGTNELPDAPLEAAAT